MTIVQRKVSMEDQLKDQLKLSIKEGKEESGQEIAFRGLWKLESL
jgi:hypothetical protein